MRNSTYLGIISSLKDILPANYVFLSGFKFRSLLDMMFSGVNGTSHFKLHYLMVGTFTVFLFLTERAACGVSLLECLLNAVQQYKENRIWFRWWVSNTSRARVSALSGDPCRSSDSSHHIRILYYPRMTSLWYWWLDLWYLANHDYVIESNLLNAKFANSIQNQQKVCLWINLWFMKYNAANLSKPSLANSTSTNQRKRRVESDDDREDEEEE